MTEGLGTGSRVLVIGLDSVPPDLLFRRFLPVMPTIQKLMNRYRYGSLRTIDPPITVPAWAVMFSGVDPGTLGIYGFRHRRPGTYFEEYIPTPQSIREPPLWTILSRLGRRVCIVGMPPGYPPPKVNGVYVSDFLTPSTATDAVWPASLQPELKPTSGPYLFDVTFRADDRDRIARELTAMTERRFEIARRLYRREPWDLFAVHEIGPDRLHHAFWKYFDPAHRLYDKTAEFRDVADDYYALLDREVAAFLELAGDDVSILIASDHGSQAMDGCFCINEWLVHEGFLSLKSKGVAPGTRLDAANVDWTKTRVWGAGGYYARLFFNLRGRDPEGIVRPEDVADLSRQIRDRLAGVTLPTGESLAAQVRAPSEIYREVRGDAPDLMAYFGNLRWRSAGTLGHGRMFLEENDTGPDDAVHSFDGFYLVSRGAPGHGPEQSILDVAPTLMRWLDVEIPPTIQGRPITAWD